VLQQQRLRLRLWQCLLFKADVCLVFPAQRDPPARAQVRPLSRRQPRASVAQLDPGQRHRRGRCEDHAGMEPSKEERRLQRQKHKRGFQMLIRT
jgi:hypothetical protein